MNRKKARISWEEIYVPKDEGGLGLMKSIDWNVMTTRHVWNLISDANHSLWADLVWENKLKR